MAKSLVVAEQKKRRISKLGREVQTDQEENFYSKLKFIDIEPPNYLNGKEKRLFRKYIKMMKDLNIISILDADILGHYVIFQRIFDDLKQKLEKEGYIVSGKINPVLGEMRQISKTIASYQIKLGLNPTDRLRFMKNEPLEKDELDEFNEED